VAGDELIFIGGVVRDQAGSGVDGAWVQIDELAKQTTTSDGGRFSFPNVRRGSGYTLRAQAVEIGSVKRTIDVPEPLGHYDLTLP